MTSLPSAATGISRRPTPSGRRGASVRSWRHRARVTEDPTPWADRPYPRHVPRESRSARLDGSAGRPGPGARARGDAMRLLLATDGTPGALTAVDLVAGLRWPSDLVVDVVAVVDAGVSGRLRVRARPGRPWLRRGAHCERARDRTRGRRPTVPARHHRLGARAPRPRGRCHRPARHRDRGRAHRVRQPGPRRAAVEAPGVGLRGGRRARTTARSWSHVIRPSAA